MGIKFPTPWKTLIIKFPPPRDGKGVKCPGYARGGHVEASIWPIHNLFRFLNFTQRFMRFNELTIFNPTIPTWDCGSSRVHRTSQTIPRKDPQKEMNEEFELITVTISPPPRQLSKCHRRTSFQCSHAKRVMSRNSAPRIWEGGKKLFHAVR